jgi:hypothetical protein
MVCQIHFTSYLRATLRYTGLWSRMQHRVVVKVPTIVDYRRPYCIFRRLCSSDGHRSAVTPKDRGQQNFGVPFFCPPCGAFRCQAQGVESLRGVPRIRTHGTHAFGRTSAQSQLQLLAVRRLRSLASA